MIPIPRPRTSLFIATCVAGVAGGLQVLAPPPARAAAGSTTGTPVYRCGNLYAQNPCAGATRVQVGDARSEDERRQSHDIAAREKRLASTLEAERLRRDAPPPALPAAHGTPPCAPSRTASSVADAGPSAAKASTASTSGCAAPRRRSSSKSARAGSPKASEGGTFAVPVSRSSKTGSP